MVEYSELTRYMSINTNRFQKSNVDWEKQAAKGYLKCSAIYMKV